MNSLAVKLSDRGACSDAVAWVESHKGTPQELWDQCARGDWMLWILGKLSGKPESSKRKQLVRATCGCARLALKFVAKGEHRPRICIETAEAWANNKATIEQVREARSAAAGAAAACGAADAAAYGAAAAATAAAAAATAYGAAAACAATAAATYGAAAYGAAYGARKQMLSDCANVVRKFFPKAPRL